MSQNAVDNSEGTHYSGEENRPMPSHEESFKRLKNVAEIKALIGTTEDLHLDCKVWPTNENDAQKMLAKTLCGFANADGGVVVIGMEARLGPNKDDPDVIQRARPVANALAVKSRVENLVGQLVEPGLEGVQVEAVFDPPESVSGFVLVGVPPTEGPPCRSRKDWKFYLRVSAGAFPMEYFQVADMFGRRRRAVLKLYIEEGRITQMAGRTMDRMFTVGIENRGRGVAKFPGLRFKRTPGINVCHLGIDGNGRFGLPQRPTEPEWIVFGGGVDHVIYPGTLLKVVVLEQTEKRVGDQVVFEELTLAVELAADECPSSTDSGTIPEKILSA